MRSRTTALTWTNLRPSVAIRKIDVRDPIAAELATIAEAAGPVAGRLAPALLDVSSVFGALGTDPRMRTAVTHALARLYDLGACRAVQA